MVGGKSGTTTNISLPSPYEKEKSITSKMLRDSLLPMLIPQMAGYPTAETAKANLGAQNENLKMASKLKIAPGSPQMSQALSLGGKNQNILNYAMQLYGMMPQGQPSTTGSSSVKPGGMDYLNTLADAYMAYDSMKGLWGGGDSSILGNATTGSGDIDLSNFA